MHLRQWLKKTLLPVFLLGAASAAFGQNSDDTLVNLAEQIAERRAKVEELSSRLDMIKADYNEDLRSLASQRSDLETQMKREELRMEQVERDLAEFRERLKDNRASMEEIKPVLVSVLTGLKEYVARSLPFQVSERQAEIDTLLRIIDEDRIESGNLLARVWNMVEGEFRLTGESGIYRQTIEVGGEEQLVEVARLGMVLMYFKTFDGRTGYVVPSDDGWEYSYSHGREEETLILELFDSLRKNLREGYFELPNPLAERK